jgi:hypothetical protein
MKKSILMMMMVAGSFAALAQETGTSSSTTENGTLTSSGNYSAYTAPSNVQMYLYRDYPGVVNVTWTPMNEYWRATYNNMGRYDHVYYTTSGDHYLVTLPVTSTWVPDEVVSAAGNLFGANVYDITTLRGSDGNPIYQVRFLDNGVLRSEWINDGGVKVSEYYRIDTDDNASNMNTNSNLNTTTNTDMNNQSGEVKTKLKTENMKVKTETENGKTKTKVKTKGTNNSSTNNDL